jgi:probable HAF family extracellular repeat protein
MERAVSDSHYKGNQMNAKLFSISLLTAGVLFASVSQSNASGYTFTVLGTLGGSNSGANGINDSGQVVGFSQTTVDSVVYHATIWDGTALHTPTDLGTLGGSYSWANGINDSGQVVGWSFTLGDHNRHATIWNGTGPTDLNNFLSVSDASAGWVLDIANGINDNGWIIGNAHNTLTNVDHAFLLTPCPTCTSYPYVDFVPAPVPEPETYAMFMAGLGLMGFIARRRKNGQA